jgi:hypothetical protein
MDERRSTSPLITPVAVRPEAVAALAVVDAAAPAVVVAVLVDRAALAQAGVVPQPRALQFPRFREAAQAHRHLQARPPGPAVQEAELQVRVLVQAAVQAAVKRDVAALVVVAEPAVAAVLRRVVAGLQAVAVVEAAPAVVAALRFRPWRSSTCCSRPVWT